jgi:hypothetical protein
MVGTPRPKKKGQELHRLVAMGAICAALLGLLFLFWKLAPVLCVCTCAVVSLIILYVKTEGDAGWWWHDAQEFENRFWSLCAFLWSSALLFAPDSPLVFISEVPTLPPSPSPSSDPYPLPTHPSFRAVWRSL